MGGCCVAWCGHNSSKRSKSGQKVSYHKIREPWIRIIIEGGRQPDWKPEDGAKICSLHFNPNDILILQKETSKKPKRIIRDRAFPIIPKTDRKKPARKSTKESTSKKHTNLIPRSKGEHIQIENQPLLDNGPGPSGSNIYTPATEVVQVTAQGANKVVLNSSEELPKEPAAQRKKVALRSDEYRHLFSAPQGEVSNECLIAQKEVLEKMKVLNQLIAKQHPNMLRKAEDIEQQTAQIFTQNEEVEEECLSMTSEDFKFLIDNAFPGPTTNEAEKVTLDNSLLGESVIDEPLIGQDTLDFYNL